MSATDRGSIATRERRQRMEAARDLSTIPLPLSSYALARPCPVHAVSGTHAAHFGTVSLTDAAHFGPVAGTDAAFSVPWSVLTWPVSVPGKALAKPSKSPRAAPPPKLVWVSPSPLRRPRNPLQKHPNRTTSVCTMRSLVLSQYTRVYHARACTGCGSAGTDVAYAATRRPSTRAPSTGHSGTVGVSSPPNPPPTSEINITKTSSQYNLNQNSVSSSLIPQCPPCLDPKTKITKRQSQCNMRQKC
eukprot:3045437-Rhodomonas_salina.6